MAALRIVIVGLPVAPVEVANEEPVPISKIPRVVLAGTTVPFPTIMEALEEIVKSIADELLASRQNAPDTVSVAAVDKPPIVKREPVEYTMLLSAELTPTFIEPRNIPR